MKRRLFTLLLTVVMLISIVPFAAIPAGAYTGQSMYDPYYLYNDQWQYKTWTRSNDTVNCYSKFSIPSRGYVTFTIEKPIDDDGEIRSYDLTLYNSNGSVIWTGYTNAQKNNFYTYYIYKVGLAAGTYYLEMDPNFYVVSGNMTVGHKYSFTPTLYWEVESNNSQGSADAINLNTTYYGVFAETRSLSLYNDYYKVYLTAGETYTVSIGNFDALKSGTCIVDMTNPYGDDGYDENLWHIGYEPKASVVGNVHNWEIKPMYTGWYYIRFYNDCNEVGTEYTIRVGAPQMTLTKKNGVWYCTKKGKICNVNTLIEYQGSWYYVQNGKVNFNATTLVKYNNVWYYVQKGKVNFNATTLVKYQGTWYYVKNGKVDFNARTLVKYQGVWHYVSGGKKVSNVTTLVKYQGSWYYVQNGKVNFNATTLVNYQGAWYYVVNGKVASNATTLVKYKGTWWYVKNGKVDFNSRTLVKYQGVWYIVSGGKTAPNATTLVKYQGSWYYVQKGKVNFNATTLVNYQGAWYYVVNGKVASNATTLVKYKGTWWYVKNGKVDFNSRTLVKYQGVWYIVSGGKTAPNATTLVKYQGSWYYVQNGKVNFNATTLVKYQGAWYYVKNGKVDFNSRTLVKYQGQWYIVSGGKTAPNATTMVQYQGTWYYVRNGKVDFTANTTATYNGVQYVIKGGKAVSIINNGGSSAPSTTPNNTPSTTPSSATYYDRLRTYINNNGSLNSDGNRWEVFTYTSSNYTFYYSLENTSSGIEFQLLSSSTASTKIEDLAKFTLYRDSSYITVDYSMFYYSSGSLVDLASDSKSINRSTYSTSNTYTLYSSGTRGYITSSHLSQMFNTSFKDLCTTLDDEINDALGFGLYELGFTSFSA